MKHILIYSICLLTMIFQAKNMKAQESDYIPIYPEGKIPNTKPASVKLKEKVDGRDGSNAFVTGISVPTMRYYPAPRERTTGSAVIIFPGGGYVGLAFQHEGEEVARAFNARGIAAFVVKNRLPNNIIMEDKRIGALQDAQQAIYLVRKNASSYGIDPNKIGIMGFSAGGHLASTAGTHFKDSKIGDTGGISLRPDFMLLIYPVISMDSSITHMGSRENLLGKSASAEDVKLYSNELQVDKDTPPTFLVHAEDDTAVPIANSRHFDEALAKQGIAHKLITYSNGGHGFGLHNRTTSDDWFVHAIAWLDQLGFGKK